MVAVQAQEKGAVVETASSVRGEGSGSASVGEMVGSVQETVHEKAGQAKGVVSRAVAQRVDSASSEAGDQLRDLSGAFRQTGEQLRSEGKEQPANVVEAVSDRTDQVARYLSESSSTQILDDLERLGRTRPWVAIAGGLAVGFAAARLLKASSQQRFQNYRSRYPTGYPVRDQALPVAPSSGASTDQTDERDRSSVTADASGEAGHGH
jgi:ElaB/YqjD/DUF883 family membrane-anchored ribosome-binding protein